MKREKSETSYLTLYSAPTETSRWPDSKFIEERGRGPAERRMTPGGLGTSRGKHFGGEGRENAFFGNSGHTGSVHGAGILSEKKTGGGKKK